MSEHPREFVVQRSKWLRGRYRDTFLLDEAGRMCCLGFVSAQCGVPAPAMLRRTTPNGLPEHAGEPLLGLLLKHYTAHTELATAAVQINDSIGMNDEERESALCTLFAEHGYALRFEP